MFSILLSLALAHSEGTAAAICPGAQCAETERADACRSEQARIRPLLMLVRKEYRETSDSHDVQTLVRLDSRMRNILEARTPGLCDDDRGLQTQEQETFGLRLGYWEELGYDGLLLSEAHAIDPQSRWRPYTLYSTLQDDALAPSTLGHAPDIAAARNYLDEFPQGPFA